MTDRIEYTFDLDGFVEEIRYYRSLTTIDTDNLPPPTAVLDGSDRTFVDYTIASGQIYHVVFSSYRGGTEKISDEIVVSTQLGYQMYRLYITANNGNFYLSINEIEMFLVGSDTDETDPIQAQTAATASQFSSIDDSRAYKAFNNNFGLLDNWVVGINYGGVYQPVNYPAWIAYDFGQIKNIERIKVYPQPRSDLLDRAPKNFIVQGSDDGVSWVDIKAFNDVTSWSAGVGKTFNLKTGIIT